MSDFKVNEVETLQEGNIKDCKHEDGQTERNKEFHMQRAITEFRIVSIFICNTCHYMARRYETGWITEDDDE